MLKRLPEELEEEILQSLEQGLTQKQTAIDHHVSKSAVNRISVKYFGKENDMDKVIAGDTKHGTLRCVGNNLFVGTCRCENGRMRKKRFHMDPKDARDAWERWKADIHAEENEQQTFRMEPETLSEMVEVFNSNTEESQASIVMADVPVIEMPKPEPQSHTDAPIYILALDSPRIAGFFTDFEEAMRVEAIMNSAMQYAGIQNMRYSILEVSQYVVD